MQVTSRVETGQVPQAPRIDAVAARRAEMQAQAEQEHKATVIETLAEDPPAREDVESIEITLPDGRVVEFGPPPGVSLTMRVATFPDLPQRAAPVLQVLLCVRSLNGEPVRALNSMVDMQRLSNQLGDSVIDLLARLYVDLWPPLTVSDLPTIKKNLRRG